VLRLAWKAVKHNPRRLILTSVSVILGVALVAAIHTFTGTIDRQVTSMLDEIYAGSDITISGDGGTSFDAGSTQSFPESVLNDVRAVDGVAQAEPGVTTVAVILTPDGDVPPQTGAPNLFFNWVDDAEIGRMTIVDGRAPSFPGEAAIDQLGMQRLGYEIGDTFQVAAEDGIHSYRIVGASWFGEDDDLSGATLVQLTMPDVQELAGLDGEIHGINVVIADGANVDDVVANIDAVLPDGVTATSNADLLQQQKDQFRDQLKYVDIFTLVFALIALFVGAFIIANTFRIIVNQRTREIGVVRALGARVSQVRGQILLEALIVAVISSVIGIGLGYLLAMLLSVSMSGAGLDLGVPTLPLDAVIWGASVGLVVTLVSALLPAIHASKISPMEAMRESSTASRKPLGQRNLVGGVFSFAALGGIAIGLYTDVAQPGIWVGVSAAVLVFGVALLSAQVLSAMARWTRGFFGGLFGVDGKLALGNVRREPRRAGITATALMIGVLLLSLVATMTETLKVTVREAVAGQITSDVIVSGDLMQGATVNVSSEAQDAIASVPGVDLLVPMNLGEVTVDGDTFFFGSVDPQVVEDAYALPTTPSIDRIGGGVFISPRISALGYKVGDTITIEGEDGDATLPITGTYDRDGDWDLLVADATAPAIDTDLLTQMVLVNIDPNADLPTVESGIQDALDDFPLLQVSQPDQIVKSLNQLFDMILVVITIMLSASLIIAVLGVANTLFLSVTERTREIGLLRAVGVRKGSIWRMITLESVVIALFGAIMGIVLGVGLGAALIVALKSFGFTSPVIPVVWLVVYAVLAVVAGIVAAIVPAWLASRLNILEAIAIGE